MFISYLCITLQSSASLPFSTCSFPSLSHPFPSYLFSIYPFLPSFHVSRFSSPTFCSFFHLLSSQTTCNYFLQPFLPNFLISLPSSSYMSSPPSIHPSSVFCLHQNLLYLNISFLSFVFSFHLLLSLSLLSFHILLFTLTFLSFFSSSLSLLPILISFHSYLILSLSTSTTCSLFSLPILLISFPTPSFTLTCFPFFPYAYLLYLSLLSVFCLHHFLALTLLCSLASSYLLLLPILR